MFIELFWIVIYALIVGVLLWGLNAFPWIDANVKLFLRILIIVLFAIYVIMACADIVMGLSAGAFNHAGHLHP